MTNSTGGTVSNNLWVSPATPEKLHHSGDCPKCGAPIYIDAKLVKKGKVHGLPTPYFTCNCRFQVQPAIQPYVPSVPTWPVQPQEPWCDPQRITWTVGAPIVPNTTVTPTSTTIPTGPKLDMKGGGLMQHRSPRTICINAMQ